MPTATAWTAWCRARVESVEFRDDGFGCGIVVDKNFALGSECWAACVDVEGVEGETSGALRFCIQKFGDGVPRYATGGWI